MMHKSRTFGIIALIAAVGLVSAVPARAQTTYTVPLTTPTTLGTNVACGAQQDFPVQNLGFTQHYATVIPDVGVTSLMMVIQGQDATGHILPISDALFAGAVFGFAPTVTGTGAFPIIIVHVECTGGHFTLDYSGTSSTSNVNTGAYLIGQIDKAIYQGADSAVSTLGTLFVPPFANASGTVVFKYPTVAVAGSSISVHCEASAFVGAYATYQFFLANVITTQTFQVPQIPCAQIVVTYTSGGASGGLYSLDYFFNPPGTPLTNAYSHVGATTTATEVKAGAGILSNLTINTPAVGTITVFDLAPAACTATPITNIVVVITATATGPFVTLPYNILLTNGICVQESVNTMDVTVGYQ